MTGFGIYMVIVYILGLCANGYYMGQGGTTLTPRNLAFSTAWSVLNLLGILFIGTGLGI